MTSKHLEELLQQCIAAFDSGISPEECLAMFPAQRAELEPLFRQAISLRVAFAASPRAEFRQRTRERVLFMAGRDVTAALSARPDPEFIKDARQRFIQAAGAEAQEALRAVPPPRMPFWANTRRRLLERAAETNNTRRPAARPLGGMMALRAGLSMAVVAVVMAVGAFFYIGLEDSPTTNAQLAQLEKDLNDIQRNFEQSGVVDQTQLQNATAKLNEIAQQSQPAPAVAEKLPDLISKQRQVVNAAANEGLLAPEVVQAQNQQLAEAQVKVDELRLAAARAEDPTSTPKPAESTSTVAAAAASTTASPVVGTTPLPTPIVTTTPPADNEPVGPGQIRVTAAVDDTNNKDWKTIELANMSFNVPDSWKLKGGIELDDGKYGSGIIDLGTLQIEADGGSTILVDIGTGRITVLTSDNSSFTLRVGGINGAFISLDELVAKAPALSADLWNLRVTFEPAGALIPPPPTPTPTPSPTATNTATPTVTPTPPPATSTPAPSATP